MTYIYHENAKEVQYPMIEFYYSKSHRLWFVGSIDSPEQGVTDHDYVPRACLWHTVQSYINYYEAHGQTAFLNKLSPAY